MKRTLGRIILLTTALCLMACSAAMAAPGLPRVVALYVNNAKTTYDGAIDDCMTKNLEKALAGRFEYVRGDAYLAKLRDVGMTDLSFAERRDIIETLADGQFDYIICLSVEPFARKEKFSLFTQGIEMTATVPFKLIDVKADRYLYNGKFVELQSDSTPIGSVGNKSVALKALGKVNKQIDKIITEKMN